METGRYLAHISEDGREQTVLEHLEGTARLCAGFASAFGAEDLGRLAGLAHDLGKYSDSFQRRIRGSTEQTDHSTAGAVECYKLRQACVAIAVMGHHGGLPDAGSQSDHCGKPTFCGRMKKELPPYNAWHSELSLPNSSIPMFSDGTEAMFFTRMLYSCLVDADFLDTEAFMSEDPAERGGGDCIEELEKRLFEYTSRKFHPDNELNAQRCGILRQCIEQGKAQRPGLFTLTVPTGGGKTVASLAFALNHARANGLRRVIYVIPYTSIIDQNARVFRDILGEKNILEHHSGVTYDIRDEARPENIQKALAAENWDIPVVVTTAVQFFESLFSNRSSKCRKLHNIARSVIIFDEAQMIPVPHLRPCVFAISQLVKHYGASAVLCTATQPSLNGLFREFLPEHPVLELCPQEVIQSEVFRRVTFRRAGELSWEDVAGQLMEQRQVLCVVNSREGAQRLCGLLSGDGVYHLSTLMFPAHRKAVLDEIKDRLEQGRLCPDSPLPCRVVSTSLIEAGVDVDFPAVFREEAGLDSILQTAGRCNREGRRKAEESVVTIFQSETPAPEIFQKNITAGRRALEAHADPCSPEAVARYFNELMSYVGNEGQDKMNILDTMREEPFPFKTVSGNFHLIDKGARTVYIPMGPGAELTQRLRSGERSRGLLRELGQYGVSVYDKHFKALMNVGAVELIDDDAAILTNMNLYSENTGLSLKPDVGVLMI